MARQKAREKVLDALGAGMVHVDAIAIFIDSSDAYTRQVCNAMVEDDEIEKVCGRAHHSYYLKGHIPK